MVYPARPLSLVRQWLLLTLGLTLGVVLTQLYNSVQLTSSNSQRLSFSNPNEDWMADPAAMVTFLADHGRAYTHKKELEVAKDHHPDKLTDSNQENASEKRKRKRDRDDKRDEKRLHKETKTARKSGKDKEAADRKHHHDSKAERKSRRELSYPKSRKELPDHQQQDLKSSSQRTFTSGHHFTSERRLEKSESNIKLPDPSRQDLKHQNKKPLEHSSATHLEKKRHATEQQEQRGEHSSKHTAKQSSESSEESHGSRIKARKPGVNEKRVSHKLSSEKSSENVSKYLNNQDEIVGDVSHTLDFAIVGFSKSATTYMMDWLRQQRNDVSIGHRETCYLNKKQGRQLLEHLSELDATKLRGFKCPSHFTRTSLDWYRTHFPSTKLIVGLRHPVSWFESFYNYRIRHPKFANATLPPAETMMQRCTRDMQGLCTRNADFSTQLSRLAKTGLSANERRLLHLGLSDLRGLGTRRVDNPVFLYEISQIKADPQAMAEDLGRFLGLDHPLQPYVDRKKASSDDEQDSKLKRFSICEPKYDELRNVLMKGAVETSDWVLNYFMEHVTTSTPDSFVQAMKNWKQDPCARN